MSDLKTGQADHTALPAQQDKLTGFRLRARRDASQARRPGPSGRLKKQCRQLQQQLASLQRSLQQNLKRQSAETCGLQTLYDQLVNEIKHHRDMLNLDSFDIDKSATLYEQAWRRFMAGEALTFQTHRHTSSRSRPSIF
ncbi:hypothetical protein [Janthinobacterium aquaticum]|uniref:hypothetical protein n=1 Tax=Janthinobacterium sp. FT58W TaxID=2654254 RepID=UPI00126525B1|nr:hypothetical protein [Janthinobacterium sp. FT58W]KAB8041398.1 hypothetical protein GCM43_18415 [Janthinobacterium sp. FT58W]